jgi:hypothetical protein
VLFPFVSPVDDAVVDRVGTICLRHPPFAADLSTVAQFPGLVVWLRPEPSAPFSSLTTAMVAEFPQCPPYGGSITEPVPHLTVADRVDTATASTLRVQLDAGLPIHSQINELALLLEDEAGRWTVTRTWPLGPAVGAS